MSFSGITINGRRYESPDAMPPDVRRLYDEGLRAIGPSLAGGKGSDTTQVHAGPVGLGMTSSIVINKTITMNNRTYRSLEEMPPEVRKFVERGLQQAQGGAAMSTHLHLGLDGGQPEARTSMSSSRPAPSPRPIGPWSVPLDLGRFVTGVAFFVIVGLALFFLGR